MAKQRLQVESGIAPGQLRPAAAPVDTFVRTNAGAQLDQLAQGLAQLAPSLGRLSTTLIDRQNTADVEAGKQLALDLKRQGKDYATEVRAGRLPANRSPWFMAGLQETQGGISAEKFNVDLQDAIRNDPSMQTTTNIEDYRRFATEFTKQWSKDNGIDNAEPRFLTGFASRANAYMVDNERRFEAMLGQRANGQMIDAVFTQTKMNIQSELRRGTSLEQIAKSINSGTTFWMSLGANGGAVNRATAAGILAAAREVVQSEDYQQAGEILKLFTMLPGGPRGAGMLSDQPWGSQMYTDALKEIGADTQSRNNRAWQEQQRAQDQAVDSILRDANTALEQSDPHNVNLKVLRDRMNLIAPDKVGLLYQMQEAASDRTVVDDPLQVAAAFRRVYTPYSGEQATTLEDAAALLAHRQISRPTYSALINEIQQRDESGGGSSERSLLDKAQTQMRRMFVSEFGFEGPAMRQKAEEAVDEFTMKFLRWRSGEGKNADELAVRQFLHDARLEVFRSKSSSSATRDFDKIPPASMGPQRPDPAKMLVTDPSNIRMLETEVDRITSHRQNKFSPQAISVLRYAGIEPTLQAVQAFLKLQNTFVPTFVPPDSTQ